MSGILDWLAGRRDVVPTDGARLLSSIAEKQAAFANNAGGAKSVWDNLSIQRLLDSLMVPGYGQGMDSAAADIGRGVRAMDMSRSVMADGGPRTQMQSMFPDAAARNMGRATDIALAGTFIGPTAKTWNSDTAKIAQTMEKAGATDKEIWSATGNWRGPDGKWRQEISDKTAGFRANFDSLGATKANNYMPVELPLGGAYSHPNLYYSYPGLLSKERMTVQKQPDWMPDNVASGSYKSGDIQIRAKTEPTANSLVLHELQHAIQGKEGFASGGSESMMNSALYKDQGTPFDLYRRLAGEAEARATQARINLTDEERRLMFPADSYDVPIGKLIFK